MPLNRKPLDHTHLHAPTLLQLTLYLESSVGRRADRLLQLVKGLTGARNRAQVRAHPCFTVITDTHVSDYRQCTVQQRVRFNTVFS